MAAKKKSNFYHIRWNRVGVNEERAAEIIGVSVEQVKEWDKEGAPIYVERLLLLWDSKNIGADGWQGFVFSRGVLKHKKAQFRPEQLKAQPDYINEISRLQGRLNGLYSWLGVYEISKKLLSHKLR